MAQVFIVDDRTFNMHLKYMFAGTGAKDYNCNFLEKLNNEMNSYNSNIERLLVGMISDISRIKVGDDILFYLQQNSNHEGMFFGSFKASSNSFLSVDDYLREELGKNLTFRIEIVPGEVYLKGVTERDCLDSLKDINHPSQMCWSMIYRKLKGNRGCTMITDYEYHKIMKKIREKNNFNKLDGANYIYDREKNEIDISEKSNMYSGKKEPLDILNRLLYKKNRGNAYETHLQAYLLQNEDILKKFNNYPADICWLGNEVSCGVGMQSIDILFITKVNEVINISICELKDEKPEEYIKNQIEKYVEWLKEYIVPTYAEQIFIHPFIVAPKPKEQTLELYKKIKDSTFFESIHLKVHPIKYIGFEFDDNEINFAEVEYE